MDIREALAAVAEHRDLNTAEMQKVMMQIMTGQATEAQMGGFLMGLRMKGETVKEIAGAARVMRELAIPVKIKHQAAVDIVGTGGDSAHLFNVSTACAIVVAAAGGTVAKHGNRSVSSTTGAADLLEAAGVNLNLSPEQVAQCIDEIGVGFMFAPQYHKAMRHAIVPRKEMGLRTIFNLLGPLTNPAGAKHYLLGVFDKAYCLPIAEVMAELGAKHVLVVSASDGLDEISLNGETYVAELKEGLISQYRITAADAGLNPQSLNGLQVATAQESLLMIKAAFNGQDLKAADMIALNAGAALYAADLAPDIKAGVVIAKEVIGNGSAALKFQQLVEFSQAFN
ncbi:MAG: anthranilate phosphoribosyltransferase [Pseudomonadales bacterium]|nr:anthranilate phosphoribosyltransferase [Pseudomonadales bacterium]NRA16868.1 anthranilate phosphoribosyltransferase [Oceanospirillaceae bacterium]